MKDRNAWSLDHYLAKQIAEGTKKLLLWDNGHPVRLGQGEEGQEKWREILKKLNKAFWTYYKCKYEWKPEEEEAFLKSDEWNEAWELFKEYYVDLWD